MTISSFRVGKVPPTSSHASSYAAARVYLRRATWTIGLVAATIGAAAVLALLTRSRRSEREQARREISRLALTTELAATSRSRSIRLFETTGDSSALRIAQARSNATAAYLDSLTTMVALDPADSTAHRTLMSIRAALTEWERRFAQPALENAATTVADQRARTIARAALLDSTKTLFEALQAHEAQQNARQIAAQRVAQRIVAAIFLIGFISLVTIVVQMRRHFDRQLEAAADADRLIGTQHAELREQYDESNMQLEQLQLQAGELEMLLGDLRASEQLQHSYADHARLLTRRLNEAQQVAQMGYWEIDSTTGGVFWSDEMYRLCGLPVGALPVPTDKYLEAVHPSDRATMQAVATNAVQNLTEFTEQYRLRVEGRPERTVQSKGRVIVDDHGDRKLVGTVQDVTDRVLLETQVRRSQKMEAIGQLAGGIAHDFNNLLTVIDGYASLMLSGRPANDPDHVYVGEIRDAAKRAAALTKQLLAFSRQQVLRPRVVNLNEAIGSVEQMLRRLVGEQIEFHTTLAPDLGLIKADPGQLEQVMMNLVVNARDAMMSGGTLTIETANVLLTGAEVQRYTAPKFGAHVMLLINDTGTGIPEDVLDKIFEPFFTTKDAGRGTGLGLSTVQGIVEQSGGHIWVDSAAGRGTTFRVYFPHAVPEVEVSASASAPPQARRGSETILLVEDDAAVRAITGAVLRRGGYVVREANNGVDALRISQDTSVSFDLVLSDMVMPGMGGRALATKLKVLRPGVPVVLMSGYSREAVAAGAALTDEAGFVEKPFSQESLLQTVREVLDRRKR